MTWSQKPTLAENFIPIYRPSRSIIPPDNKIIRIKLNLDPSEWCSEEKEWFEEVVFNDPEWPESYAKKVAWTETSPETPPTGEGLICEVEGHEAKADEALAARNIIERCGFDMRRDFYGVAVFSLMRRHELAEARRQWKEKEEAREVKQKEDALIKKVTSWLERT